MTDPLAPALALASSRLSPPPTPLRSALIHGAVLAAWVLLFVLAFRAGGLVAWSVGLAYVAYDTLLQGFVGWQTWRLLRPPPPVPSAAPRRRLAVIVAAHDEAAVLPATLAALLAQSDPADEIVIADDGSSDGTAALLASRWGFAVPKFGASSEVRDGATALVWLRLPHGGKARALNAAILRTGADIVLTVDADTLLDPRALEAVRRAFSAEPALAGITGVITPVCKPSVAGRCLEWFQTYEYIRNFLSRYAWMRLDSLLLISGAFAGFRREAVVAVGGFDPACLVEDYELIHRLRRHAVERGLDWRFRVLGDAQARTEAPGSVGAFLRQRRRWFGGFLQTQWWYRAMVGDRRHGWLGVAMLPVKAVDTLQPLFGLTAFVLLVADAATGRLDVLFPVAGVIGAKIAVDLAFHLWSVHLYRRWVGDAQRASFAAALVAALAEPFTFQLLRHTGAALGWVSFLSGERRWGRQTRFGLDAAAARDDDAPRSPAAEFRASTPIGAMAKKNAHVSETPATQFLRRAGVAFSEHPYDYVERGGTAESARQLGVDEHAVVKTLVMQNEKGEPLIALMHGDRQVSTKNLARAIGAKSVAPCAPEVAERASGYQVGGTSPFATRKAMPVFVEATVLALERIYINGGRRGYLVGLEPAVLVEALGATPVRCAI